MAARKKEVLPVSPAVAKRQQDTEDIKDLNRSFAEKLAREPKIPYTPPKYYADIMGKVYPFALNGHTIVVRFDGTKQYFPETVYNFLIKKLGRILDESTPVNKVDNL